MRTLISIGAAVLLGSGVLIAVKHAADGHEPRHAAPRTETNPPSAPVPGVRITMEELHRAGGVPPGWRFTWPEGNPGKGRDVFAKLECYQCHQIKGETFPPVTPDPRRAGPELTGMGSHHPVEYFAEAIVNPNAVIVTGPGHTGPDGRSIMPDYRDNLTAGELIDLIAFLKNLKGEHDHGGGPQPASAPQEQAVGDYRVRVAFHGHVHGGPHRPAPAGHAGQARGHLVAFIYDARSGEPVPYLPVTATVYTARGPGRSVKLEPMVGQRFHYGADVLMPPGTTRVTIAIGRTTMRVMESAGGRFTKPALATFSWTE